ncbi:hypothetical protein MAR_028520, partial [Mya arenaria]
MKTGILVSCLLFAVVAVLTQVKDVSAVKLLPRIYSVKDRYNPDNSFASGMVVVGLKTRFKFYMQPIKPHKDKSLLYLTILLLSLASDIESNPGPDFPCGTCGAEVLDSDPAVECDKCGLWFHIQCQNLEHSWYQDLIHTDASFAWTCTVCDNSNHSITSSILSISSTNSFSALSHENTPLNQKSETQNPHIKRFASKLKFLLVNCQSIVKKKHEFHNLLSEQNPDIVAGTESWLTADHYSSEIFPESLGYTVFRRDRKSGKGVQLNLNTNCEILWIKLEITGSKPIYISSFYKPHELDIDSIYELEKSLLLAQKLKGQKIILGDFNLPKLSWDTENNPILQAGYNHAVYDKFLDILSDFNLTQMVNEYTREGNILDLLLLSNPTLVQSVNIISGISDHDIVSASISARPTSLKQKPRVCSVYSKANWPEFRKYFSTVKVDILHNHEQISVEELWQRFKSAISTGIATYIPIKHIRPKRSLPWINKSIRKLLRKRNKLYQKVKQNKTNHQIWKQFKKLKCTIKIQIKQSYDRYLENILDISNCEKLEPGVQSKFSTKK